MFRRALKHLVRSRPAHAPHDAAHTRGVSVSSGRLPATDVWHLLPDSALPRPSGQCSSDGARQGMTSSCCNRNEGESLMEACPCPAHCAVTGRDGGLRRTPILRDSLGVLDWPAISAARPATFSSVLVPALAPLGRRALHLSFQRDGAGAGATRSTSACHAWGGAWGTMVISMAATARADHTRGCRACVRGRGPRTAMGLTRDVASHCTAPDADPTRAAGHVWGAAGCGTRPLRRALGLASGAGCAAGQSQ